ncbi:FecR domain-containing protein [Parasphingorhabdus flavimaris]|uniref:FecR domain-containing protein n=1 Tax=Parasphingorhabdus flavimaris TaxID=266812 RepID=A0ABX2N2B4_9SPHN|nr:FecR family protein [Parasphingorhabdus flavimaris]NVD27854.1 FecR domain-containing protein [Parasphingorhabdus flavimaris]
MKKTKIILTIAALMAGGSAQAETPQWKLSESAGTVNVLRSGVSRIAISGGSLTAGDVITTGTKSRAVLVRGQEYVVVSPNSRLRISAPEQSGGVVQFFEELGNVLFRIDKKSTPHFGVKTPYLAAVVKGTTFSVTVTESGTAVQVTEGAVQVSTLDGGATQLLSPGMIGMVDQSQQFRLTIAGTESRTIDSPNAPAGSTDTPEPVEDAALVEIANSSFEGTITAPVLEAPVSLSDLTGGLVSNGAAPSAPAPARFASLQLSLPGAVSGNSPVDNGNPGAVGRGNSLGDAGSDNAGGNSDNANADAGGKPDGVGNGNNGENNNAGGNSNNGDDDAGPNYGGDQPDGTCNGVPNCRSGPNPNGNGDGNDNGNDGNGNGNSGNGNGGGGGNDDGDDGDDDDAGNGNNGDGNGNGNGGGDDDGDDGENDDAGNGIIGYGNGDGSGISENSNGAGNNNANGAGANKSGSSNIVSEIIEGLNQGLFPKP